MNPKERLEAAYEAYRKAREDNKHLVEEAHRLQLQIQDIRNRYDQILLPFTNGLEAARTELEKTFNPWVKTSRFDRLHHNRFLHRVAFGYDKGSLVIEKDVTCGWVLGSAWLRWMPSKDKNFMLFDGVEHEVPKGTLEEEFAAADEILRGLGYHLL